MDVTERVLCGNDLFNPVLSMGLQASLILSLSHLLQIAVKPFGIPSPLPQITAGLLIGHSLLSKISILEKYFFNTASADYYNVLAFFGRTCVVFLMGLELDLCYLKRHLRAASIIAFTSALPCAMIIGGFSYLYFRYYTKDHKYFGLFLFVLILIVANSASPLVICFISELRLGTSDFGRLAICSSLVNDVTITLVGALLMKLGQTGGFKFHAWLWSLLFTILVSLLVRRIAVLINQLNPEYQYLRNSQIVPLILLILLSASFVDRWGAANSIVTALAIGVAFPREGKTARTMCHKLSFAVYTFVLPIYFGYTGFQVNFGDVFVLKNFVAVSVVILVSIGGKIAGTLVACRRLNIPNKVGIVLGLLLSLKGHVDVLILGVVRARPDWNDNFVEMMLLSIVLNTLLSGIAVTFLVIMDTDTFLYKAVALEHQDPENELRLIACVHGPRNVPTMVKVIGWLSWSKDVPLCAYLLQLVELLPKKRVSKMYNQLDDNELSDDEAYGRNDAVEINETVDTFIAAQRIFIRQLKIVANATRLFEDICEAAEDLRASMIILPFHKHQRIDGKMESGKDSMRSTNQRVLRHAPCTVAILIDRGLGGFTQEPNAKSMQHVASLFFGGADDREALTVSTYLAMHQGTNLAVIRFLQASVTDNQEKINISLNGNDQVLMAMPSRGVEDEVDNAFLEKFYNRYVTTGKVGYIEKPVKNGAQTAAALRDIVDMYELFIVGNGSHRNSPITTDMSDWEECPELGNVGDLLASSDFDSSSSVLVVQQYRPPED